MRVFVRPRIASVLTTAAIASCPLIVHASGFALLEQSASRLGAAFAGTAASADDATTIFFNPAGLVRLEGPQAAFVASGIEITSEFNNSASQPALGQPLGGGGGDAGDWNFVPAGYIAWPINESLAVGFGVGAPFGLKLEYDGGWVGRFQALNNEIKTYNFNPSISWAPNERFSIGLGVNYQRLQAELTNAVNYSAVVAQGVQQLVAAGQLPPASAPGVLAANTGLEGGAAVRGDDDAWSFNIGLLFDATDTTRIGLSYRSGPEYEVEGSIRFTTPTRTGAPSAGTIIGDQIIAGASGPGGPLATGPATVDLELPAIAIASLRQEIGARFALLADIGWTQWSNVQELRVVRDTGVTASVTPEEWDDVFRYALGGEFAWSDALTLRFGAAYDETPVPDRTRTPRLPDPDRTWLAIGARWSPSETVQLDFGYAHLFSDEVPLNHTAGVAQSGLLVGEQESDVDIVSTQLVWRF